MNVAKYKHIAEVAGVSPASVTRFFDNGKTVSDKTEKKITQALRLLRISLPVNNIIGLIIPDSQNPYFTSIAFEFERVFEAKGWHLLISNSDGKMRRELDIIERYKGLGISGLIYINSGSQNEDIYGSLIAGHDDLPVLSFDRPLEGRNFDYVVVDSKKGTLQSVDWLVTRGHQRIANLRGLKGTTTAKQRYEAFEEAMAANRLKIHTDLVFEGDYQLGAGVECADRLIEMPPASRPTAIICANDLMAIGLIQRLQKEGWRLPEELSIVGFDDIPMSKWVYPALTTIEQPIRTMVIQAADMILKRIAACRSGVQLVQQKATVTPMLVPRASVAQVPESNERTIRAVHISSSKPEKR